jgi:choline dehydrogenase
VSDRNQRADYVVVGAGPAGCVLAARLSEDPDCQVLLIEAGGRDWNPLLGVPLMTGLILRSAYANWSYVTEPEPQLNGRRTQWARGRVLGGSSSIHGMVYMRGLPIDFTDWAARGLTGWSYDEVLPYFLRSENSHRGGGAFHATGGPLTVSAGRLDNPLFQVYLQAAQQAGHPKSDDFAGPSPHGAGAYDFTIRNGRRVSASSAFLRQALHRPNLRVVTQAQALCLNWDTNGRVQGVDVLGHSHGEHRLCRGRLSSGGYPGGQ